MQLFLTHFWIFLYFNDVLICSWLKAESCLRLLNMLKRYNKWSLSKPKHVHERTFRKCHTVLGCIILQQECVYAAISKVIFRATRYVYLYGNIIIRNQADTICFAWRIRKVHCAVCCYNASRNTHGPSYYYIIVGRMCHENDPLDICLNLNKCPACRQVMYSLLEAPVLGLSVAYLM